MDFIWSSDIYTAIHILKPMLVIDGFSPPVNFINVFEIFGIYDTVSPIQINFSGELNFDLVGACVFLFFPGHSMVVSNSNEMRDRPANWWLAQVS